MCRELKHLHPCHHLSWFLFGLSPCEVLVLVVFFMTSSSLTKMDFIRKTCCVFGIGDFTSSSLRKVPHLPMCVISSILRIPDISSHSLIYLVVTFLSSLISS